MSVISNDIHMTTNSDQDDNSEQDDSSITSNEQDVDYESKLLYGTRLKFREWIFYHELRKTRLPPLYMFWLGYIKYQNNDYRITFPKDILLHISHMWFELEKNYLDAADYKVNFRKCNIFSASFEISNYNENSTPYGKVILEDDMLMPCIVRITGDLDDYAINSLRTIALGMMALSEGDKYKFYYALKNNFTDQLLTYEYWIKKLGFMANEIPIICRMTCPNYILRSYDEFNSEINKLLIESLFYYNSVLIPDIILFGLSIIGNRLSILPVISVFVHKFIILYDIPTIVDPQWMVEYYEWANKMCDNSASKYIIREQEPLTEYNIGALALLLIYYAQYDYINIYSYSHYDKDRFSLAKILDIYNSKDKWLKPPLNNELYQKFQIILDSRGR